MALKTSRMKFKVSELPLEAAQRSAIDGLVHTVKKRGEFDTLRKKVWAEYAESVSYTNRQLSIETSFTCV